MPNTAKTYKKCPGKRFISLCRVKSFVTDTIKSRMLINPQNPYAAELDMNDTCFLASFGMLSSICFHLCLGKITKKVPQMVSLLQKKKAMSKNLSP